MSRQAPDFATPYRFRTREDEALVLNARYRRQRFAPHAHQTYAIGLVTSGALAFQCDRKRWTAAAGSICLVNPGEVHTGEAAACGGWSYWNAYLPVSLLAGAAAQLGLGRAGAPMFASSVVADGAARAALGAFFAALRNRPESIAHEALLLESLAVLLGRFAEHRREPAAVRPEPRIVAQARDYMSTRFTEPMRLGEVADAVGVTGFHLTRLFKATTGLAAHAWLVQYRAERAREMLLQGVSVAQAAAACGFSDQPHLTRWLRRLWGMTPGQIRATSRTFKTAAPAARMMGADAG